MNVGGTGIVSRKPAAYPAVVATQAALPAGPINSLADFSEVIQVATKELAEIRPLRTTTRRRLDRIWENLRHVEGLR